MDEFTIDITNKNDVSILNLNGFLDAHTSVELEKTFEELISKGFYKILVNFEKLSYISSAGLGVFMAYIETMRENGGDIKMCSMNEKIYNIFDMLGFPILFEIYSDEQTAMNKFTETASESN